MAGTVTATQAGAFANGVSIRPLVFSGQAVSFKGGTGISQTAYQAAVTIAATGSHVVGANLAPSSKSLTAASGTTMLDNVQDTADNARWGDFITTALTSATGSHTYGSSASFNSDGGVAALEIKGATSSSLTRETGEEPDTVLASASAASVSSKSFTPSAGNLVALLVNSFSTGVTISDTLGGLTWTEEVLENNDGYSAVWTAVVPSGSTPVSGADTGTGADTATVAAALSGSDTGTGTDTAALAAAVSAADTGTGTDTATTGAPVSGADTSTGTDTAAAAAALAGTDTATGTDTASVAIGAAVFTQVQLQWNPTSGATSSIVATLPDGVTEGNLVTVAILYGADATITITPPDGSWVQDEIKQSTTFALVAIFRLLVDSGHAGETSWTFTTSAAHNGVPVAAEWSSSVGWDTSPLDVAASTNGRGTALATGTTADTAQAAELWVGFFGINSVGVTFTSLDPDWTSSVSLLAGDAQSPVSTALLAWEFPAATGTAAASVTSSASAAWGGAVAAYKAASVSVPISGADTAAGTDTASVAVAVSGTDAGTGTDTGSAGRISAADTAAGTDTATVAKPASTFPAGPLGAMVELDLGGTWTDATPYTAYRKQLLQFGRGHPDESTTTNPSTLSAVFDNTDKRFTSTNPTGAWYGLIGRNTPVRLSIPEAATYLRIEGDNTSYAQAPDSAGLSVTGDMDVRLDLTLGNWRAQQLLAGKWADTGNERTWLLTLQEDGTLTFSFSSNGTGADAATSTLAVPVPALRRQSLRVTYATATGTIIFYTATSISGSWTQLGTTQSFASSIALYNSTAPLQVGYCSDAASDFPDATGIYGQVHELILMSGIGGTIKADAGYSLATAGASSYTDAQSNVWTCKGTSEISSRKYLGHFEASAWTPYSEGTPGLDLWCGLSAGGLLRRITQDTQTLGSVFTRALPSAAGLAGFWTCEDGNTTSSGATPATPTQFASAIQGAAAGTFTGGPPSFASDSTFLCSQALPSVGGARWHFRLPGRQAADTANVWRFLLNMPAASDTNDGVIARVYTTGTIAMLDLVYTTGGGLTLNAYGQTGTLLGSEGPDAFGTDGTPVWASVEIQKSGSDVQYSVVTLQPGASSGLEMTGTTAGSVGNATELVVNGNSGVASLQGTVLGQISYQTVWESLFDFGSQLAAYQGEAAGQRFARLCSEQGIAFRAAGSLDDTVAMGAQTALAFFDLLQECADADNGVMFEPRTALALGYRTGASLLNQSAAAALDYSLDGYAGLLQPAEDDQYTKNDVTATRAYAAGGGTGSSAEVAIGSGPLSVQPPPAGAGPYLDSVTVNLQYDSQLADAAGWRAYLGTIGQPRYPSIPYDLARHDIGGNLYAIPDVDPGDRVTIGNTPEWEPPDGIEVLASQITGTIGEYSCVIGWCGVPGQAYQTGTLGDVTYGIDTDGSQLHAGITATATSIEVDTLAGTPAYLWTTNAADFPFDIKCGGERMTVTDITGSSSPQAFTVTRSVNGVVKAHDAGADVSLFCPLILTPVGAS